MDNQNLNVLDEINKGATMGRVQSHLYLKKLKTINQKYFKNRI